jgi:hypothetical protein
VSGATEKSAPLPSPPKPFAEQAQAFTSPVLSFRHQTNGKKAKPKHFTTAQKKTHPD